MKKITIIFVIAIIILMSASKGEKKEIRVRVIPEDNSSIQYEIKQEVISVVKNYLKTIIDKNMNYEEMDKSLNQNYNQINKLLSDYNCKVSYQYYNFPLKSYNDNVIKEKRCKTLLIEIGKAKGDNWWGSLYPDLLSINSEEKIEYRSFIKDMFGGD